MNLNDRYRRIRGILASPLCVFPASVYDPLSARIAEDLGFELGMLAGSTASLTVLGAPDIVLLTLTEFCDQARRICRASDMPLLVDADHGYGNALNVMRTVEELQAAGVAALTIEDTQLPRSHGETVPRLIPLDEATGKVRAALAARGESGMAIVARANMAAAGSFGEVLARAAAYAACGADALFLSGIRTRAELDEIASAVKIPMIVGNAAGELSDPAYLAAKGVRIGLLGHQPILAAMQAVHATLSAIRDRVPPGELRNLASPGLVRTATKSERHEQWAQNFLNCPPKAGGSPAV